MPRTSANSTRVFFCLRTSDRSGAAILAGESDPVATWYNSGWNK